MGKAGVGGVMSLPASTPLSMSGPWALKSALSLLNNMWCWNKQTNIHVTKQTEYRYMRREKASKHYTHTHTHLRLWHTWGVRPLGPVLLCPAPPWVTEAWMIRDITSLATEIPCDTHAALAGLDSWIHTDKTAASRSLNVNRLTGIADFNEVYIKKTNRDLWYKVFPILYLLLVKVVRLLWSTLQNNSLNLNSDLLYSDNHVLMYSCKLPWLLE